MVYTYRSNYYYSQYDYRPRSTYRSRSKSTNLVEDVEIGRICNKNKQRKLITTVEQTKPKEIELSILIIAKQLYTRLCFDLQTLTEIFNHQFLKRNFNTPPHQYHSIYIYQYYKQCYDFEILVLRSCKKIFECENIKLNKSDQANSQANFILNSEKESSEKKGKANDSQEKQDNSLLYLYFLDKLRENEDVNIKTSNDCKSKDRERLLHCLEHQHVKCEQELLKDLLSTSNFRLKPCNINVYIVDNVPRHPARLGNIQWSWLVEEIWRIRTFSNYPQNAAKSAILLASDGFAYMGSGRDLDDSVICFFCESVKNKWQPLDDICEVHKQLSPSCSMVTHINCPNIPLKTNHDSSLFDKVFKIQKYQRNLNASANRNSIQDIEHDGEIIASNRSNLPVSSQAVPEHAHSIVVSPSQSSRADDSSQSLSSASPSVKESPSNAVSSIPSVFNNATTAGNTVLSTASNLVSDSSTLVTVSESSTVPTVSSSDTDVPSTNTVVPSINTAAGNSSATASTSNTVNQAVASSSQNATKGNAGGPTYSELGIVTERPKRFEYAVLAKRIETFSTWPRDHHLRPKELAEAGFYYAGYGDCARCFYCGGGLRNWEDEDDVWVEHARWFPKCAYIRQQMGQVFVDIVQELNKTNDHIPFQMVMEKIGDAASTFQLDSKDNPLKRDPAVKTIVDMGFPIAEVIAKAEAIKDDGNMLSADKIYEKLVADNVKKSSSGLNVSRATSSGEVPAAVVAKDIEKLRTLKEQNNQLRQQTVCKICMDKEVAVVFLPCGHFVSCTDCAAAMKDCPVCRNHVKGLVRAFMS